MSRLISADFCRKHAKSLHRDVCAGQPEAIERIRRSHPFFRGKDDQEIQTKITRRTVQKVLAIEKGFADWEALIAAAELQNQPAGSANAVPPAGIQVKKTLAVRFVDPEGRPVRGAMVKPWALRDSRGHGAWEDGDIASGMQPQAVTTNENGEATVVYPCFRNFSEGTRTTKVSLLVDHRDYAVATAIHCDVTRDHGMPHEITIDYAVPLELRPMMTGSRADLDNLFVSWSDARSWRSDVLVEKTADATLRLPGLKPGMNSVLVARLDGNRVTHFSKIVDVEVSSSNNAVVEVPLSSVQPIEGALSDDVPRPITNGRINLRTLNPRIDYSRVIWHSWAPIRADGTFTIDAWPTGEKIQLIALCDGYAAKSGTPPVEVENARHPAAGRFGLPQVFESHDRKPIRVEMERLAKCVVTTVDEEDKPLAGVRICASPNVFWWNSSSQIYCEFLVRGERLLRERSWRACLDDNDYLEPFRATTDAGGNATLELPAGKERLYAENDSYEMPVFLGRRDMTVELVAGQTSRVTLRLQRKGTEELMLGEWEALTGVLFGWSRKGCAMPETDKKVAALTKRFRESRNQRDPQLLAEAYALAADALADSGDHDESAKWRARAAAQTTKAMTYS